MAARRRRSERTEQYESPAYRRLQKRLAKNVRGIRAARKWTQEDAAHRCGMSTRLLQMVEAGHVNVTLTTIARLTEGLEVDILELLAR
jgi:transcriptional regulator with XRE-family HTH domain